MPAISQLSVAALLLSCLGIYGVAAEYVQFQTNSDPLTQPNNTIAAAGAPSGVLTREFMQLHTITHVDQLAVCNDGSPGAYYHRNGAVDNSTRWVIRFLGGAWCWDGPSCAARNASTPYLMSTSALPAQTSARTSVPGLPDVVLQSHGITSWDPAQNPHFNSWNHVHVWYCSSDSHLGDASPGSGSAFGAWQFRGRRIAAAVIADLLAGRGLSEATHVLLTGDSAGGVGVMNLADDIAGTLRDEAPDLEMVKLFVDAGWFLDISPYANRSDGMTFEKCAKALPASYGAVFDRSCEQHFGAISSWRCFFAQDCQAFIETPALFHEYLYDSANLGYDGAGSPAEAEDFRSRMEASIKAAAATGWNGSCDGGDSEGVSLNNTGARLAVPQAAVVPGGGVSRQGNENGMGLGGQDCEGGSRGVQMLEVIGGRERAHVSALSDTPDRAAMASVPSSRTLPEVVQLDGELLFKGSMTCSRQALRDPNIFSPACQLHEMIDSKLFTTSHVGDVSFVDVLGAWFAGQLSCVHVLDRHRGARGGDECGFDPAQAQQLVAMVAVGV